MLLSIDLAVLGLMVMVMAEMRMWGSKHKIKMEGTSAGVEQTCGGDEE